MQTIKNKSLLAVVNVVFLALVIAQETHYIDVFPIADEWKKPIKATIAVAIALYNAVALRKQK